MRQTTIKAFFKAPGASGGGGAGVGVGVGVGGSSGSGSGSGGAGAGVEPAAKRLRPAPQPSAAAAVSATPPHYRSLASAARATPIAVAPSGVALLPKVAVAVAVAPALTTVAAAAAGKKEASAALQLTDPKWRAFLHEELAKPYWSRLESFVASEDAKHPNRIYPPPHERLFAFNECPFDRVRCVILGQDPYHGPGQAHGLAFSVKRGVQIPPSLRNMYKELASDTGLPYPQHGNLTRWAQQGVLLLNTVLTVRSGEAHSHKDRGWETFTDAVIRRLSKEKQFCVFILWGKPAEQKIGLIDRSKHAILTSSHPSPLSATKTNNPFIGSKVYSRANAKLEAKGLPAIDWRV